MLKKTLTIAMMSSFALALSACDVRKTEEGNVTLPKYEIDKTQQGSLKLPEYDVKTPEVNVRKEEKTVEVPTVKKEERTIEVPNVDVTPARDK